MKTELNKRYKKGFGEIKLFQTMADILKSSFNVSFVKETHRHYVSFDSKTIKKRVRREISDLWIIVFSSKRKIAKMTFLQAKFHKTNIYSPFRFTGDFFQHELLSSRPDIHNKGLKYNLPTNILSYTDNDTIGTYGVFYFDSSGSIDFAYATASLLKPKKLASENKQTSVSLEFPRIVDNSCLIQLNSSRDIYLSASLNIDCFTQSLLGLKIGAEIQSNFIILAFIKGVIDNSKARNDLAFRSFVETFSIDSNEFRGGNTLFTNILLIDTDMKNEE